MKKTRMLWMLLLVFVMVAAGCSTNAPAETVEETQQATVKATEKAKETTKAAGEGSSLSYDGALKFIGLDNDFEVAYNDIYAMPSVTADVKHISSSGEEFNQTVTGVKLEDILGANGASKMDYTGVRFTAGDGYAVTVPAEVFTAKDVILAWEFDGEGLDEKKMPLRVAIHDERSMFYVSNLVEVALEKGGTAAAASTAGPKVVLMESAFSLMETEEFMYYDSNDLTVGGKALMKSYATEKIGNIDFVASDGYEKTEAYEVVKDGFIKINGEDAPLFTGNDLPKGMNVKYILKMVAADAAFVSVNSAVAADVVENKEFDGDAGVKLSSLIDLAGLEADAYVITATDGYAKEITREQAEIGMAYVNNSSTVTIKFDDGNSKKSKVKNALTITAVGGAAVSAEEKTEESKEEAAGESWVVTFEGLSDGAFDFDQGRAERKLEKVSLHTEHMKNDEKKPNDWEGYRVLDILDWLKVEDFSSIIVVAGDGYEVELLKEMVDDETILADIRNGEAMTDADNLVQLVQNSEFATTWVKGVAKVIVKQ